MHERVGDDLAGEQLDGLDDLAVDRVVLEHVAHEASSRAHHGERSAQSGSSLDALRVPVERSRFDDQPPQPRSGGRQLLAGLVGEPAQLDRVALGLVGFTG